MEGDVNGRYGRRHILAANILATLLLTLEGIHQFYAATGKEDWRLDTLGDFMIM